MVELCNNNGSVEVLLEVVKGPVDCGLGVALNASSAEASGANGPPSPCSSELVKVKSAFDPDGIFFPLPSLTVGAEPKPTPTCPVPRIEDGRGLEVVTCGNKLLDSGGLEMMPPISFGTIGTVL